MRSTWDYERRRDEFLAWTEHVDRWSRLLNGPAVFRWNTDKSYLLDLERAGVPVVPTALLDDPADLPGRAVRRSAGRVVVKPRVAAGGRGLGVQDAGPEPRSLGVPSPPTADGPWVVQPLVESVRTEGETSVFVLGGVPVSQARKLPGGGRDPGPRGVRRHVRRRSSRPTRPRLLAAETVAAAGSCSAAELAYARVDLMRLDDGRLVVGELEVTEPGLYLDALPGNADAFAERRGCRTVAWRGVVLAPGARSRRKT